jgi:hypothetical protein
MAILNLAQSAIIRKTNRTVVPANITNRRRVLGALLIQHRIFYPAATKNNNEVKDF